MDCTASAGNEPPAPGSVGADGLMVATLKATILVTKKVFDLSSPNGCASRGPSPRIDTTNLKEIRQKEIL